MTTEVEKEFYLYQRFPNCGFLLFGDHISLTLVQPREDMEYTDHLLLTAFYHLFENDPDTYLSRLENSIQPKMQLQPKPQVEKIVDEDNFLGNHLPETQAVLISSPCTSSRKVPHYAILVRPQDDRDAIIVAAMLAIALKDKDFSSSILQDFQENYEFS